MDICKLVIRQGMYRGNVYYCNANVIIDTLQRAFGRPIHQVRPGQFATDAGDVVARATVLKIEDKEFSLDQ